MEICFPKKQTPSRLYAGEASVWADGGVVFWEPERLQGAERVRDLTGKLPWKHLGDLWMMQQTYLFYTSSAYRAEKTPVTHVEPAILWRPLLTPFTTIIQVQLVGGVGFNLEIWGRWTHFEEHPLTKLGKNMAGSKVESRASCVPLVFAEKKHIKNDVQKREFHGSRREFEIGVF